MPACEFCSGMTHGEPYKTWLLLTGLVCFVAGLLVLLGAGHRRFVTRRPSAWPAVAGLALTVGVPVSAARSSCRCCTP